MEGIRSKLEGPFMVLERLAKEQWLLSRLRAGVTWITEARRHLPEYQGQHSELELRYHSYLEKWDGLEKDLRESYSFRGCIFGQYESCSEGSPVRCRECGGVGCLGEVDYDSG